MFYQIWNGKDDIYTPAGTKFTAEQWADRYPWVKIPGVKMVITSGVINGGVAMEFNSMVEQYKEQGLVITEGMTDEDILAAIENFQKTANETTVPTTEERTAAALEYIAMSTLPDETEV